MKTLILLTGLLIAGVAARAQVPGEFANVPITHIQTANEMYQNNSQFTNKDNLIDPSKPYLTGNGTYWVPGYSNPANRESNTQNGQAPNTSINPVQSDPINYYIQEQLNTDHNSTIIIPRQVTNNSYPAENNW